ncbi:putative ribonuclease H-like domain-containing protein [Tanacetum coccineum]
MPNSTVVNAVRANQVNVVKASACWIWRPTKLDSASITLKRHNYVDARGRSNWMLKAHDRDMSYLSDIKEFNGNMLPWVEDPKRENYWVFFLTTKDETSGILKSFITEIENLVDKKVKIIRCDNGTKFKNKVMSEFCEQKGIKREYSNRVLVVKPHNKTPYELFRGKFDGKSDEGFFVGYSMNSKAFRVYNIRTRKVEEKLHYRFLEDKPIIVGTNSNDFVDGLLFVSSSKNASNDEPQPSSDAGKKDDEGVCKESGIANQEKPENSTQGVNTARQSINTEPDMFSLGDNATLEATHADLFVDEIEVDMSNITTTYPVPSTPNTRIHKDNSLDHVIGDVQSSVLTRRMTKTMNEQRFISAVYEGKTHKDLHTCLFAYFLSQVEPKKGYTQEEGIDYDEVFALVARIEAIRLFLAYASFMNFVVYQMDVKSAFLYGKIEEEVYVCQPPGFEDLVFPNRVYKVKGDILLVQIYIDDILFGSTKKELCIEFEKLMHKKFQMSFKGELTFFLGLQVMQKEDGIFISQDKYVDEIVKKFDFSTVKTTSTPMETLKPLLKDAEAEDVDVHLYRSMIGSLMYLTAFRPDIMFAVCQPKLGLWYPKDSPFDLEAYSDSDYAGASLDKKSTTGGVMDPKSNVGLWIQLHKYQDFH